MYRFKTILSALALATSSLSLGGCAAFSVLGALPITSGVCSHTTVDEKSLFGAEAVYNAFASTYVTADQHGLLNPTLKAQLKPLLQKGYTYLKGARAAYDICDSATLTNFGTKLQELNTQILPLIPRVPHA